MLEFIKQFMIVAVVVCVGFSLLLVVYLVGGTLLVEWWQKRKTKKFFNKIEEWRNDIG